MPDMQKVKLTQLSHTQLHNHFIQFFITWMPFPQIFSPPSSTIAEKDICGKDCLESGTHLTSLFFVSLNITLSCLLFIPYTDAFKYHLL